MKRALGPALLVVALLLYPFLDRALGFQTVHAVSDGMIYVLLALGLNIVVGYAGPVSYTHLTLPTIYSV